ncbi:hypothetical protein [Ruegeria arenilitoris]|uniref:SCP-2 sterol transfer family protein n=1 Tax=Ruegeria arenilitoris TaxID=1173585 RepID=A0A238KNY9_9RHOB|nr:hypothetical protein [Ruegeria arenilitoris]SMX44515.1 hypothetical protein RUA8715_02467 [Ruegeria arenilitoris]
MTVYLMKSASVRAFFGLFVASSLFAAPAASCSLEALDLRGFSVDHRGSIPIALATRAAIDAGQIEELPKENSARYATLFVIRYKAIAHMRRLTARATSGGPELAVLLTQSGAWMRINDPQIGARYHARPAAETEMTVLLPDTVYAALLDGELTVQRATELGLLRVYGTENRDVAIHAFADALSTLG